MKINILNLIAGAKEASGIAIIIDVFRAFSFECYLIRNNVDKIIPVASKDLAYEIKQKHPEYILTGERKGKILPGFDYGNSPSQIEHIDLSGKTVVHTTSAGTQGLENAKRANEVITGSLVNSKAIAKYILKNHFEEISLVCMGNEGTRPAEEDTLCAEYIKSLLQNRAFDIQDRVAGLKYSAGAKFFDPVNREVFPERDFHLCTAVDSFDFILKFEYGSDGLGNIIPYHL